MEQQKQTQRRSRRALNELVVAEMFLIQATVESVAAIGGGVSALGRQLTQGSVRDQEESVQKALKRIKDEATEPYTSRYRYLKDMRQR